MSPTEIKDAIRAQDCFLIDVARTCGVSHAAVRNTIYRRPFSSPKVRAEIARLIGIPESKIWN